LEEFPEGIRHTCGPEMPLLRAPSCCFSSSRYLLHWEQTLQAHICVQDSSTCR